MGSWHSGQRGVLISRWGSGLPKISARVFFIESVLRESRDGCDPRLRRGPFQGRSQFGKRSSAGRRARVFGSSVGAALNPGAELLTGFRVVAVLEHVLKRLAVLLSS